jgi:hypothetical protein
MNNDPLVGFDDLSGEFTFEKWCKLHWGKDPLRAWNSARMSVIPREELERFFKVLKDEQAQLRGEIVKLKAINTERDAEIDRLKS